MKTSEKKNTTSTVSNRTKIAILFVDFFMFALIFMIIEDIMYKYLGVEKVYPWIFRLIIYFVFFTMSEFVFNATIGMKLMKVSIVNRQKGRLNMTFILYSLFVVLDRFLLFIFIYSFRVLMYSNANLILAEKISGLRWSKKPNVKH